jgi:hypothetical protein
MANEVRITTSYSFSNLGATFNGANTLSYSITGDNGMGNIQTINSGKCESLDFQDLADCRWLYLKNQSESGHCQLSLNSGQTQIFSRLGPSESLAMPPYSTGMWATGLSGADISLQVLANET